MIVEGRLLIDPREPPAHGWIEIEDDRITAVRHGAPTRAADAGDPDAIICPGFTDAHFHLPQVDSIGCDGMDLLDWLDRVIYPAELAWADAAAARAQVDRAFDRLLRAGTLAFAGYLTSHPDGTGTVAAAHGRLPLRATVGASWVDRNVPAAMRQPAVDLPPDQPRLRFSANPRFAVACTAPLLDRAGDCAVAGRFVQTHLAEQLRECALVRELFPNAPHYTGVYDAARMLTPRTLLAHCVHLEPEEWSIIADCGAVVVHCPTANLFLRSGFFDLPAARQHGVRLALGSDVAAGADIAMPRVARAMIDMAKARDLAAGDGGPVASIPTPADAWELITRGNADALGLEGGGRIAEGAAADLLVLRPPVPRDEHLIGRLLYTWRDDYIAHRIVAGRLVQPSGL